MKKFIFVLGRDIELSLLELFSYFEKEDINYSILDKYQNLVVLETDKIININKLGGLVKIAEIIDNFNIFLKNLVFDKNKIIYTVNDEEIKELLKEKFKEEGIKAFYKTEIKSLITSSKLDFEFIKFKNYISQVIQVSNPKEYKNRDETRPYFDAKKVTSIRLAKILINLSKAKNEILDPFCGQGTILQEALLMNLNCYGLDANINEAKKNLEWLKNKFNFKSSYKLFQGDARNLSKYFRRAECSVTEPYLGPYFKKYPKYDEALNVIKDLEKLYIQVFQELDKIIEKRLVILLPVIKTNVKKNLKLNINKLLQGTKFRQIQSRVNLPILYSNKGAVVEREIYILEKSKL